MQERGDRVEEARLTRSELALEPVRVEPLVVHRQRHDLGSQAREDLQRTIVGGRLDQHAAGPRSEKLLRVEDEALEPSRRQQDAPRIDSVASSERLAQRRVAPAGTVGEHRRVGLDRGARTVGEKIGVEALRRRRATGERDHAPHTIDPVCCYFVPYGRRGVVL